MAQAEFLRIVKPDKINYAEIYWSRGRSEEHTSELQSH